MTLRDIAEATDGLGWRLVVGELRTQVLTGSLAEAAQVAARVAEAAGQDAGGHLRLDVRTDRLHLALYSLGTGSVTAQDVELAGLISVAVGDMGLKTDPGRDRTVQLMEIGIDALDIAAIRPFWKAVLGYANEPGHDGPQNAIVDPDWQGPAIWFQQMDEPRPQRNRIHFDIRVPREEAQRRMDAAIAAGGRVTYDAEAPKFWVLADPEGNEICVCTWDGRLGRPVLAGVLHEPAVRGVGAELDRVLRHDRGSRDDHPGVDERLQLRWRLQPGRRLGRGLGQAGADQLPQRDRHDGQQRLRDVVEARA
jgi:4a-hydroxytetrahydrobiopterin dehydratase